MNCGFFGNHQPLVAQELDAPFFSSSLLQIPTILATLEPGEKVLVMTADGYPLEPAITIPSDTRSISIGRTPP